VILRFCVIIVKDSVFLRTPTNLPFDLIEQDCLERYDTRRADDESFDAFFLQDRARPKSESFETRKLAEGGTDFGTESKSREVEVGEVGKVREELVAWTWGKNF